MGIGIGGRADANGSGSSAYTIAQANKPKTEPAKPGGTAQPNQKGSANTTVSTTTGSGSAGVKGGTLAPAEPDAATLAGARKAWTSVAAQAFSCREVDVRSLVPTLNEIARASGVSDKDAIRDALWDVWNMGTELRIFPAFAILVP